MAPKMLSVAKWKINLFQDGADLSAMLSARSKGIVSGFTTTTSDFTNMAREAREIASWGSDTYVKIPNTNTKDKSFALLINKLLMEGFLLNVTAIYGFKLLDHHGLC